MKHLLITLLLISSGLSAQITRNACTDELPVRIVVLGSSTAAGTGPSHPDSTWVNRYRAGLKQINPNNEVINLAVGGYTTYRIMPDNFITPSNRPTVDSAHNITEALSLNPDAIVINLPSNDRQWPMSEQLANFDSLYRHGWNNGVPVYICTTQPIAGNWGAYQASVKDSIQVMFGPNAIDFFTPLADSNGVVSPSYAADAVHLNDAGHRILFQQVWNHDLLVHIIPAIGGVDLKGIDLFVQGQACAGNQTQFSVAFANLGDSDANNVEISILIDGTDSISSIVPFLVGSCSKPIIWFGDSLTPGTHRFDVTIICPQDINPNNDAFTVFKTFYQQPVSGLEPKNYFCYGDSVHLPLHPSVGDTLYWLNGNLNRINVSDFLFEKDTGLFIQSAVGPFVLEDRLTAASSSNISFNGNMFNLIADSAVTLEEIHFVSASTGTLYPIIDITPGSYLGKEGQPGQWTRLLTDTVQVNQSGDSISLPLPYQMAAGDTLGVYIHFASSGQSLRYQSVPNPVTFHSTALHFQSGSGIAYNFGTDYPNRAMTATISYDYGFNPTGKCSTSPQYIEFKTDSLKMDWPEDTILGWSGGLLEIDRGYTQVSWTNIGSNSVLSNAPQVYIDSSTSRTNFTLEIRATSPLGCAYVDTIDVIMQNDLDLDEIDSRWRIYPNPASSYLKVDGLNGVAQYSLIDLRGTRVCSGEISSRSNKIDIHELPSGVYVLKVWTEIAGMSFRIILTE